MEDRINGVDRQGLFAAIAAMTDDPGLAHFNFRIDHRWVEGGLNRSTVTDFYGTVAAGASRAGGSELRSALALAARGSRVRRVAP